MNQRSQKWDIVLIGHSRGGIFAHELSRKITGSTRIRKLYTILLDPTASVTLADYYPSQKASVSHFDHNALNLYDNRPFFDFSLNQIFLNTISDQNIPGYTNEVLFHESHWDNASHSWFADDYIEHRFSIELAAITNGKGAAGTYSSEGVGGFEVIKISAPKDFIWASGSVEIVNGNLRARGEVTVGGIAANGYLEAGTEGIAVGVSVVVLAANAALSDDGVAVQAAVAAVGSIAAAVGRDGASVFVETSIGVNAGAQIGNGKVEVSAAAGNSEVTIGSSGSKVKLGGTTIISI